nr:MAG TPA: hypothetical protein [Caudoviricetes sp.]
MMSNCIARQWMKAPNCNKQNNLHYLSYNRCPSFNNHQL